MRPLGLLPSEFSRAAPDAAKKAEQDGRARRQADPGRAVGAPGAARGPVHNGVMDRFEGHIAGIGTTSGTRLVVGRWDSSPFGAFTDVMLEDSAGRRTLLAPSQEIADYVRATYSFDDVVLTPVTSTLSGDRIVVDAGQLRLRAGIGGVTLLGRLLGVLPRRLATHPRWLAFVNPVASRLVRGVATAGSAGNGRTEYYGVTSARAVTGVTATWHGSDLGALAPVSPPVRFGFSSAPARPQLVSVTTTIRRPEE